MFDSQNLSVVVIELAIAEIVALLLAVDVVMRPRSSQGAIAWSVALVALPLLTIPLYLIFGRTRFQGYAEALREAEEHVGHHPVSWYSRMAAMAAQPREDLEALESVVQRLTNIEADRRLGDDYVLELRARFFTNAESEDTSFAIEIDDYLQLQMSRYF